MARRRRGPEFERAENQRVVIGPYEPPTPGPTTPEVKPTLLERLRGRFTRTSGPKGPKFVNPDGVRSIRRPPRKQKRRDTPRRRPSDFVEPEA